MGKLAVLEARRQLVARATKGQVILFEQDKIYSDGTLISHVPMARSIKNLDKLRRRFITHGRHDIYKSESRKKQIAHDLRKKGTSSLPYKQAAVLVSALLHECEKRNPGHEDDYNCNEFMELNGYTYRLSDSLTNIVRQMDLNDIKNIKACNNIVLIENSFLMLIRTAHLTRNA